MYLIENHYKNVFSSGVVQSILTATINDYDTQKVVISTSKYKAWNNRNPWACDNEPKRLENLKKTVDRLVEYDKHTIYGVHLKCTHQPFIIDIDEIPHSSSFPEDNFA